MANCVTCDAICERAGQHRVKTDCVSHVPKDYRHPHTNADRIRAMTDEELASWLNGSVAPCPMPTLVAQNCPLDDDHDCDMCWLDWLKAEAEGEGK